MMGDTRLGQVGFSSFACACSLRAGVLARCAHIVQMMKAFQNFYENKVIPGVPQGQAPGPGIQDHYIGAIAALAQRFINTSTVVGALSAHAATQRLRLRARVEAVF